MIISASGRILSLKLKISMETGVRPIELYNLIVKDFDPSQRTIYPTTAKHGNPRKIKISQTLSDLLQDHITRTKRNQNDTIFRGNPITYGKEYREVRNKLAKKLNDPTLKNIRLYDLRHYFGTTEYNKTKDIKRTQYLMGHKHSSTTDIYVHISENGEDEEYTCKTATNLKEATDLIEHGFEYITDQDGTKLFKKRK